MENSLLKAIRSFKKELKSSPKKVLGSVQILWTDTGRVPYFLERITSIDYDYDQEDKSITLKGTLKNKNLEESNFTFITHLDKIFALKFLVDDEPSSEMSF
ncbi:MAG: hypothetical protein ACFFD1_14455 [Candidatus Thorarchaeota archaeon]